MYLEYDCYLLRAEMLFELAHAIVHGDNNGG